MDVEKISADENLRSSWLVFAGEFSISMPGGLRGFIFLIIDVLLDGGDLAVAAAAVAGGVNVPVIAAVSHRL